MRVNKMDRGEIYQALEEEFAATFIKELIPGILHNFANPLNSIMGRSKLLQRRIEEIAKQIEEMRFFNFYLDFKHEIKKVVQLNNDVPSFRGNNAELSLTFWKLIRFAMSRALSTSLKEFQIKTEYDNKYVSVFIRNSGGALPASDIEALMESVKSNSREMVATVIDRGG